jgi:hemolysin activation/secretion protein
MPDLKVPVAAVSVEGASAYPSADLAGLTADLVGPAVAMARIEAARIAILERYRNDGYLLTTITASLGDDRRLRFRVTEGRVAEVKLEGDIGAAGTLVLRFLRHLTQIRPIDQASLERWLLLSQDIPGVAVHAVLQPSSDDPGALTLVAQVSRTALNGLLTVDNRAFHLTGPQEGLLVLDVNSLSEFGEKTEFSIYRTAGDTQTFGQASEEFFAGASGLRVRVYGGYGQSSPSDYLRLVNYEGFTTTLGAAATYPVIRSRQQTLNVAANFDVIESETRTASGPGGAEERASRDSLRVGRVGAEYAVEDLLAGGDRTAVNTASLRLSQGLPFLGGTSSSNPTPGRAGEDLSFTKIVADVIRTQSLWQPWVGATVAIKGLLSGQYSNDVLPPAEKFLLGGSDFTRGFYAGQTSGDSALAYSIELQLNTAYDTTLLARPFAIAAQFYAFYDGGNAWQNLRTEPDTHLASEGLGVRLNLTRYTEFDVEAVHRQTRVPEGTPGIVKPLKADALYWRVLARF